MHKPSSTDALTVAPRCICSLVTTTETLSACDFATRLRSETDTLYKPSESLACCSVTTQHHTCSCPEGRSTLASALHLFLDTNVKNWRSVAKITINVTSCYMKSVFQSFSGIPVAYWYEPIVKYSSPRCLYIIYMITTDTKIPILKMCIQLQSHT